MLTTTINGCPAILLFCYSAILLVSQVTSAAFGGADLSTLYITTARENFTPADRQAQPQAGDIFACAPGVPGRLPYLFGA